jgi:hypothetical protein
MPVGHAQLLIVELATAHDERFQNVLRDHDGCVGDVDDHGLL